MLFIGTPDNDEIVQFLESDDLIAVSGFGTSEKFEKGIRIFIDIINNDILNNVRTLKNI